ncbi:MAG TPA: GH116 family glycosyl hydrolase [Bryobacteraceae bacterium]|nr:GH116 family glycosyl hydrolase [Bryobacteraceae bacterium]
MKITRRSLLAGSAAAAGLSAAQTTRGTAKSQPAPGRRFTKAALKEIAFPLGGIGTGTVSLGGRGDLRDWEIFNRPNKGGVLPFTFVSMRLEGGGLSKPLIRVVERQPLPPFTGSDGLPRDTALGLPRFPEAVFTGSYPFATVEFLDRKLPVGVSLEAFNPMVPLATAESSLPVALLTYKLHNRAASAVNAALAFSIMNPVGYDGVTRLSSRSEPFFGSNLNEFRTENGASGLYLSSSKYGSDSPGHGSMAVVTEAGDISYRLHWEHGEWWDEFQKWWDEFLARGRFPNNAGAPSEDKTTDYASLASHFTLKPGETRHVTFVLAWHFPNTEIYWRSAGEDFGPVAEAPKPTSLKNQYGTRWPSAWEPAVHALREIESLGTRSRKYRDTLYASTLPGPVIDAVSSQASILRTNTVMVMEGNVTLAFEGCNDHSGCCPMNCTHVYNYEQAMAHLYPDLERSMRETDFHSNLGPDGSMSFRTPVPLRSQSGGSQLPAADGQMGCIMKVYREWMRGAGDEWLRDLWPAVKRALEYAWVKWDADRDGVMEGEQHNTYDIEFYGPNTMMGTLYLGALAAAARMAEHLGDQSAAQTYRKIFEQGRARLDQALWNGEYYVQKVDESTPKASYYQYGEGCLSDQLLGQWFAEVVGLEKLLPHDHLRSALASIFRYNFNTDFADFANAQRIYALNDEKGLLLCSWPKGKRPALPFVYSDEVWTGIEYQVAAHLIYEDMVKEGLAIVEAARARYDGARRNPWNEIECGNHYARAMSSWSVLTAISGFDYSAPHKAIRFAPRVSASNFRCLYSTGTAWGSYAQQAAKQNLDAEIAVEGGALELAIVRLPFSGTHAKVSSSHPAVAEAARGEAVVRLSPPVKLSGGQKLKLTLA